MNCIHSSGHCGAPAALYESAWQFMKDHPFLRAQTRIGVPPRIAIP